ncbi:phage tail domain-containing protein [Shouchella rhizosphaerae]|uniref:phage tail domain-containing protein n=1 Tax=Shouchella rhizosphaerae TaxID=866786 RepID=UPI003BAF037D
MTTYEEAAGLNGAVDMGAVYGKRYMVGDFYAKAADEYDFLAMRDEIFALFNGPEPFYIAESREPGKRWLVRTEGRYSLDRQRTYGFFQVNFVSASPFSESIGLTTDPATFTHLDLPVSSFNYTSIQSGDFRVYNAGTKIDPRNPNTTLRIIYKGSSESLRLYNHATGDYWRYDGRSNDDDTITIDGVRSLKNGLSIVRNTNLGVITLAPGWNRIVAEGVPTPVRQAVQAQLPRPKTNLMNPFRFEFKYNFI